MKIINIGSIVFVSGIILDLITTLIGMLLGFKEGNPLGGFSWVFSINIVILVLFYFMYKKLKKARSQSIYSIGLLLIGCFRVYIAFYNIKLILGF